MILYLCYTFFEREVEMMPGISLYPDQTSLDDDIRYMDLAHQYHYQRVFMSISWWWSK